MKNFLKIIIAINIGAVITICISNPFFAFSQPIQKWSATEWVCDIPSSNPQQQYTRGECYQTWNGQWLSCTDWACTLRYSSDRPN